MFDFERYSVSEAALSIMESVARIADDGCIEYPGGHSELRYGEFNTIDIYLSWSGSSEFGIQFIRCSYGDKKSRKAWATMYKRGEFTTHITERVQALKNFFAGEGVLFSVLGWRPLNVNYVTFGKAYMRIPCDTYKTKVTPNAARSSRAAMEKESHEKAKASRAKPRDRSRRG